jgi:hypothetical protein
MNLLIFLCLIAALSLSSCGTGSADRYKRTIDIEAVNRTSVDLRNLEMVFHNSICRWGVLIRNASATYAFFPLPSGQEAELHWIAGESKKSQKVDISLMHSSDAPGRLTVTILDDDVRLDYGSR